MNMIVRPPRKPRDVTPFDAWMVLRPMLAPYLRKLVLAAVRRFGVNTTGWPT